MLVSKFEGIGWLENKVCSVLVCCPIFFCVFWKTRRIRDPERDKTFFFVLASAKSPEKLLKFFVCYSHQPVQLEECVVGENALFHVHDSAFYASHRQLFAGRKSRGAESRVDAALTSLHQEIAL